MNLLFDEQHPYTCYYKNQEARWCQELCRNLIKVTKNTNKAEGRQKKCLQSNSPCKCGPFSMAFLPWTFWDSVNDKNFFPHLFFFNVALDYHRILITLLVPCCV